MPKIVITEEMWPLVLELQQAETVLTQAVAEINRIQNHSQPAAKLSQSHRATLKIPEKTRWWWTKAEKGQKAAICWAEIEDDGTETPPLASPGRPQLRGRKTKQSSRNTSGPSLKTPSKRIRKPAKTGK